MKTNHEIPNTFHIAARAAQWLEYESEEELEELIASGSITQPCLHVGAGSNLLFVGDYPGTVLHSRIRGIEREEWVELNGPGDGHFPPQGEVYLRIGAGELWDDVVAYCVDHNYYGTENLSLIPGEMGAAAVQNIGAYGMEVSQLIVQVETVGLDGKRRIYPAETCRYGYRTSLFKQPEMKGVFITRVLLRLSLHEHYTIDYGRIGDELRQQGPLSLKAVRQAIIRIRQSKLPDPAVLGNAGSFFKNPVVSPAQFESLLQRYPAMPSYPAPDGVKIPAGWLIEQCGWKGRALGPAAVHHRQALVLVNLGKATAHDILALARAVQEAVADRFGINLEPEVNVI